jgi:hypothetical protein
MKCTVNSRQWRGQKQGDATVRRALVRRDSPDSRSTAAIVRSSPRSQVIAAGRVVPSPGCVSAAANVPTEPSRLLTRALRARLSSAGPAVVRHGPERQLFDFPPRTFSDPNDLLSYPIPDAVVRSHVDSRLCPKQINVTINIASVRSVLDLGEFANSPRGAHRLRRRARDRSDHPRHRPARDLARGRGALHLARGRRRPASRLAADHVRPAVLRAQISSSTSPIRSRSLRLNDPFHAPSP